MFISKNNAEVPKGFFKKLFWNFLFGQLLFSLLFGLLSLFGIFPIDFNDQPTYGVKGFLVAIFFAPLIALTFAVSAWVYFMLGNIILKKIVGKK